MADREKKRGRWKYKNLNISRMKRAFQMKFKTFFIVFEGYHLVKNKNFIKKQQTQVLIYIQKTFHTNQIHVFMFIETQHMVHKNYIKLCYCCQHKVVLFLNESQSPLSAALVKQLFVNQLLTVIVGMNIWCIVFQKKDIRDKIEIDLKQINYLRGITIISFVQNISILSNIAFLQKFF